MSIASALPRAFIRPLASPVDLQFCFAATRSLSMAAGAEPNTKAGASNENSLPKLSPAEFRTYNRMAERMEMFHNHFRQSWNLMYDACVANKRPKGLTIRQFINEGLRFCSELTTHHSIEEAHVFPYLAERMPAFRKALQSQHNQIHNGLDAFEEYLEACRTGERELRLPEVKALMDAFRDMLWQHLEDEVRELGAEEMRKYWSLEEMGRMRM